MFKCIGLKGNLIKKKKKKVIKSNRNKKIKFPIYTKNSRRPTIKYSNNLHFIYSEVESQRNLYRRNEE